MESKCFASRAYFFEPSIIQSVPLSPTHFLFAFHFSPLQVVLNYREAARIAARAGVTASPGDPVAEARQQTQKSGAKNMAAAAASYRPQIRPRPALLSVRFRGRIE
jgi:hypothetical protein